MLKLVWSHCLKQGTVIIYGALLKIYTLLSVQTGSTMMEHFICFLSILKKIIWMSSKRTNFSLQASNQYRPTQFFPTQMQAN
jgi:hypothetical protein